MSVHALVSSPLAKGLFHRAVAESGPLVPSRKLADAEQDGARFAESKGAKSIAALRAMSWEQLTARAANAPAVRFAPVADNWLVPESPTHADVPFLIGSNADENGATPHPAVKLDGWRQRAARFGESADAFLKLYPAATDDEAAAMSNASARDQARASIYLWSLKRGQSAKSKIFTYFYTHPLPGPDIDKYGAFHTSEVPYVFNSLTRSDRPFSDADRKLAETISTYWANFARSGDPNGKGLPQWPAVSAAGALTMELGDHLRPIPVADPARLAFFRAQQR
jgi:para-nitrobenzyl esterase